MKNIVLFAAVLRIIIITAIIGLTIFASAQSLVVKTKVNTSQAGAMLVSRSSKGFLPALITTEQRTGISLPLNGFMPFGTDTKTYLGFCHAWKLTTNNIVL